MKMMKLCLVLCIIGCLASAVHGQGEARMVEDRVMVRVSSGMDSEVELAAFFSAFHSDPLNVDMMLTELDCISPRGIYLLELVTPPGTDFAALNERIETSYLGLIRWGEIVYDSDAPEASEGATGSTYVDGLTDEHARNQYAMDLLGVSSAQKRAGGAHQTVAILDTGIDAAHPFFDGVVLPGFNMLDGSTTTSDVGDGEDTDDDGEIDEMVGHGTFVAGLVHLIAPDAKIMPIVVIDPDGRGTLWDMTKGIYAAIDRGVEVINISVRSTYDSAGVEDAIDDARALGIVTVGASGNHNLDRREFPSARSSAFGVAALNDNDIKADFSSFSDKVFISAPGDSVFVGGAPVLHRSIISALPDGRYGAWEGTSMATPLVAGAAALVRSQDPVRPSTFAIADATEAMLEATAIDIYGVNPAFADDESLGAGRLDIQAAVAAGPVAPSLGDLNASGSVDVVDLLMLLEAFGETHHVADLTGNGIIDVEDLLTLLIRWD